MQWTINMVAKRFEEAVDVLQILPDPGYLGYSSRWPDMLYLPREIARQTPKRMRLSATPQQVTRMIDTCRWVSFVNEGARHLIWQRAEGLPLRMIAQCIGVSRSTVHKRWRKNLQIIADELAKREHKTTQTDPHLCVL